MVGPVLTMGVAEDTALREAHESSALPAGEEPWLRLVQQLGGACEGGLRSVARSVSRRHKAPGSSRSMSEPHLSAQRNAAARRRNAKSSSSLHCETFSKPFKFPFVSQHIIVRMPKTSATTELGRPSYAWDRDAGPAATVPH